MDEKVVLDGEDIRRTLVRIAHEIVERTGGEPIAIVGIHRRGAIIAARLRELVDELVSDPVPLGDISVYVSILSMRRSAHDASSPVAGSRQSSRSMPMYGSAAANT